MSLKFMCLTFSVIRYSYETFNMNGGCNETLHFNTDEVIDTFTKVNARRLS